MGCPRRAARVALTLLALVAAAGCDLMFRPELSVTPTILEFPANVTSRSIEIQNTGAEGSILRFSIDVPARVSAWPTGGTLTAGATAQVWLSVDRSGLTEGAVLVVQVSGGGATADVTAIVDAPTTSAPAPCPVEPDLRYAGVVAWPPAAAAAAFAAAGVEPTGVLVRWTDAGPSPRGVDHGERAVRMLGGAAELVTSAVARDGAVWLTSSDPVALAQRLATQPGVRWAELDGPIVRPTSGAPSLPDDPAYLAGEQWWLDGFGFAEGRLAPDKLLAADVVVAVIDTGLRTTHEEHAGRVLPGRTFAAGLAGASMADADGHGTHVAGLIAAAEGNGRGIVGIASHAGVRVQPVRIFSDNGSATIADLVAALRWSAGLPVDDPGGTTPLVNAVRVDVINMSLGTTWPSAELRKAVIDARCEGALLVGAAGNGIAAIGQNGGVDFPAAYPEVISVGSIDQTMVRSVFSDFGEGLVDVVAPGGRPVPATGTCSSGLWSSFRTADDAYACLTGTSMATPLVAGAAAVLIASDPQAYRDRPGEVERALRQAAARRPGPNSAEYGFGVLCLDALVTTTSVCGEPVAP